MSKKKIDPVLKELSKNPVKFIPQSELHPVISDHLSKSSSEEAGALLYFNSEKSTGKTSYFAKAPGENIILPYQEYLAGTLYRITGANAPKQKWVLSPSQSSEYQESVEFKQFTASKETIIYPLYNRDLNQVGRVVVQEYMNLRDVVRPQTNTDTDTQGLTQEQITAKEAAHVSKLQAGCERAQEYGRLMGSAFCIGDSDRNPANYYYTEENPSKGRIGKFDHDLTFSEVQHPFLYSPPSMLAHVRFLEMLGGSKYDETKSSGMAYFSNDENNNFRLYNDSSTKDTFSVSLNTSFFDKKKWIFSCRILSEHP